MPMSRPYWETRPVGAELLQPAEWTLSMLEELKQFQVPEGLYVEYKDGDWFEGRSAKWQIDEVRRYIAGFMNAEGGILVLGMDEAERPSDDAKIPASLDEFEWQHQGCFKEWIERAVQQGGLLPLPRTMPLVHVVNNDAGQPVAAVIRVEPALDLLVTALYRGRQVFFGRMGESTLSLDEWAVRAILLGRRRTPRLTIGFDDTHFFDRAHRDDEGFDYIDHRSWNNDGLTRKHLLRSRMFVTNESFVWASQVDWGILFPFLPLDGEITKVVPCPPHLKNQAVSSTGEVYHLARRSTGPMNVAPFGVEPYSLDLRFWGPSLMEQPFEIHFGVYLVAEGALPRWFRVEYRHSHFKAYRAVPVEPPVALHFTKENIPKNVADWHGNA